jgi:hypothetical protein
MNQIWPSGSERIGFVLDFWVTTDVIVLYFFNGFSRWMYGFRLLIPYRTLMINVFFILGVYVR